MRLQPVRLYLLRHGEVAEIWRGRIYGCLEVELSEEGRRQARWGARQLEKAELDAVYSSPLRRARTTADLVASQHGLPVRELADLREIDRGTWAGRSFEDVELERPGAISAWHARPGSQRPPGGESLTDLAGRVRATLASSLREDGPQVAAVAAHAWVVRVLLCDALGLDLDRAPDVHLRTGSVSAVEWADDRPTRLVGLDLDEPL